MSETGMAQLPTAGMRHALLVLDMQSVFISPHGPFENTGADSVVAGVNDLTTRCRGAQIPVLFSRYTLRDDLLDAGLLKDAPFVRDGHLCSSAPISGLDERVTIESTDVILEHNRPSGFFASDLDAVLNALGVDALIVAGVSVNNAVGATARDAFARDIPVLIPRQAVAAAPGETNFDDYLRVLNTWTAHVVDVDQIPDGLRYS